MQRLRAASTRVRRLIAVAASYALALQLMLAGIATSHPAAAEALYAHDVFVLCSAPRESGDQPDKPPAHDAACAPCTLAASSPVILPAPAQSHFALRARTVDVARVAATVIVSNRYTPRQSRGPPASA
jgi:hypothetical protein